MEDDLKSFAFILNPLDYKGEFPIQVIPKHTLHPANETQVREIKKCVKTFSPNPLIHFIYECKILTRKDETTGNTKYDFINMPSAQWRYWVISFEEYNSEIPDLQLAISLLKHDFELGFTVISNSIDGKEKKYVGIQLPGPPAFSYYSSVSLDATALTRITETEINSIKSIYDLIKQSINKYEHIKRAFERWKNLKSLPRSSDMLVIGLFSVIECIITHKPTLTDSSDSLSHQVETKVPLLRKYFRRKLDYTIFFGDANEKKIWNRLYEYRSKIVHGEKSILDGKMQFLKNKTSVIDFLNETVKLLLMVSLDHPTLVTDLQKC